MCKIEEECVVLEIVHSINACCMPAEIEYKIMNTVHYYVN